MKNLQEAYCYDEYYDIRGIISGREFDAFYNKSVTQPD